MALKVAHFLKAPLWRCTEGVLGKHNVTRDGMTPKAFFTEKVQMVCLAIINAIGTLFCVPLWLLGEVIEVCCKEGRDQFKGKVELGTFNANEVSLDPEKTHYYGTGTSTFQSTSEPKFCKGSVVHDALKDPELGLGKGVDVLTEKGRHLTMDLLIQMNANTFRFSVEWADVIENGFDRYVEAAKHFHENEFNVVITLDHWIGDGSIDIFEKPGDMERFVKYAEDAYQALRPYVSQFLTFNEPNVDAAQKYVMGDLPPGKKVGFWSAHRLVGLKLQAHCRVYDALHALEKANDTEGLPGTLQVGLTHQAIAMKASSRWNIIARIICFIMTYLFHESFMQKAEKMKDKFDFLGVQFYSRPMLGKSGCKIVGSIALKNEYNPGAWMVKGMKYRFDPQGILPILEEVDRRIQKPLMVTEIGSAGDIPVEQDLAVDSNEERKAEYYKIAMRAMRVAQDRGVNLIGTLFWTMFPNIEWQHGYDPRTSFGIVARDLTSGKVRITKGFRVIQDAFAKMIENREVA